METLLISSDDRDPATRVILAGALDRVPDNILVETIGNATSDRIGLEWREGRYEVEFRHLDRLAAVLQPDQQNSPQVS